MIRRQCEVAEVITVLFSRIAEPLTSVLYKSLLKTVNWKLLMCTLTVAMV